MDFDSSAVTCSPIELSTSPDENNFAFWNGLSLEVRYQNKPPVQVDGSSRTATSRRGPGRPKKGEQRSQTTGRKHCTRTYSREVHNDSAMRSRAKFNTALAALWNQVPEEMQVQALGEDAARQIPRAEKVEIVILYIRSLEAKISVGACLP